MEIIKKFLKYFTCFEKILWSTSVVFIVLSFVLFGGQGYMTLAASLVGVTSLIFIAKGNPFGQVLMIIFGSLYGIISFSFAYYGEMITYMGMSVPMAVVSLISWLRNPYKGNKSVVKVNRIGKKETGFLVLLTVAVTAVFFFLLDRLGTSNLLPSTVSVTTSFAAAYLTARRSPFYALLYAFNDVVLIVLWVLAAFRDFSYISVIICFAVFLVNDMYGFISWMKMEKLQSRQN